MIKFKYENPARLFPAALCVIRTTAFYAVMYREAPMVYQLWTAPMPEFRNIMSQSMYEGGAFGASDLSVTVAIVAFLMWCRVRFLKAPASSRARINLKFIWLTSLLSSLLTVHSLKWIVSRARPKVFFSHEIFPRYSMLELYDVHWPGFTTWDGMRGLSWNSFPSGHTATASIFIIACYLFWDRSPKISLVIWIFVTLFAVAMGIARSMAGMHWLSDSVASYFLVWIVTHITATKMGIHSR